MDGSAEFREFLNHWLEDVRAAGWISDPTPASRSILRSEVLPTQSIVYDAVPDDQTDAGAVAIRRMLDEEGTAWMSQRRTSERDTLAAPENRNRLVALARSMVDNTSAYSSRLASDLNTGTADDLFFATFFTLLQGPRLAAIIERTQILVFWYELLIALKVIIQKERLRRDSPEHDLVDELRRSMRRGRNRLSSALRNLAERTQHFSHSHQLVFGQQLTALTSHRARWQQAQQVAGLASQTAPTQEELSAYRRYQILVQREREISDAIDVMSVQRTALRRTAQDPSVRIEDRRAARAELRTLWPDIQELQRERQAVRSEKHQIRSELSRDTRRRIQLYLEAERRGVYRESARRDRDSILSHLDGNLHTLSTHVLSASDESARWEHYELLLDLLLTNSHRVRLELLMDSYLKVARLTERRREIGLAPHRIGQVQWLTYPGHGDNAVDWNCHAGLELHMAMPDSFRIPKRYQFTNQDRETFTHQSSSATARVAGTDDLQDIFGKIAYGLLGRSGSRAEPLAALLREHGESEIAPPHVLTKRFQVGEVSRLLTGLAARNLTPIDNAGEFNQIRTEILRTIEQEVGRREGVSGASVIYFDRSRLHAASGAFGLGRFVRGIAVGTLLQHTVAMLTSNESSPFSRERRRLINRIWQLLVLMRSAGAEPHRSAASVTVQHRYLASGTNALRIEVYYTHMHRLSVSPGQSVSRNDLLGYTGSTGNAVNSHVHIEIRLLRDTLQIGTCLPHEFFPISS